jgi:hypothetical protein
MSRLLKLEHILLFVHRLSGFRVEVERFPRSREGVVAIGMLGLVSCDAGFKALLADITPGADCVGGYGDVEVGHSGQGVAESQSCDCLC